MRLAVLFARFGPYHHARLRAAGKVCDLTAIEFSAVDKTYAWEMVNGAEGFERETLFSDADYEGKSPNEVRRALWRALDKCNPAIVAIPGWATVPALLALAWCRHHNVPAILMSDSQEGDEPRTWWKEWVKSRVVKQFGAGLVGGTPHINYLSKLGVLHDRLYVGYDVVDNGYFSNGADLVRRNGPKFREKFSLPNHYFLSSSRFVEKKNLPRLIDAYALLKARNGTNARHLVVIGDGSLRPDLEVQIHKLGLTEQIHLPGFKQYDELPLYYGLADVYIQASTTEQWGLVVNEAMASGLPVLVSNRCGCGPDLVQEGVNGYTFDPYDVEALAELLAKISADRTALETMGQASRTIIANWAPETFAENLLKAAQTAKSQPLPDASWFDRVILKGLVHR